MKKAFAHAQSKSRCKSPGAEINLAFRCKRDESQAANRCPCICEKPSPDPVPACACACASNTRSRQGAAGLFRVGGQRRVERCGRHGRGRRAAGADSGEAACNRSATPVVSTGARRSASSTPACGPSAVRFAYLPRRRCRCCSPVGAPRSGQTRYEQRGRGGSPARSHLSLQAACSSPLIAA
jgi:hypothetical protein